MLVKRAMGESVCIVMVGMGSSRAISMSKTKKIRAKRKKRKENGARARLFGSKPHSNGEHLSRLGRVRLDKNKEATRVRILKTLAKIKVHVRVIM